ncbi:MAG: hypothetical protein IPO25_22820 [Saprospiraceae bacterium]|nr:hypothetical protein [Saprospiraceae bacterium]
MALKKYLDPSSIAPYLIGDTVKFVIIVYNQGNQPIDSINNTDSIPSGYTF